MKVQKNIRIGQGIDNIILGNHLTDVIVHLPPADYIRSLDQEAEVFREHGYVTENFLQFQIGFDEVHQYQDLDTYPIFKLFFKDERLVYIIFTSYSVREESYQTIELDNGIRFLDSMETVRKRMGEFDKTLAMESYDGKFTYYSQGVELIFAENTLRVINLFKPFGR
ncbi:MAG: hypothetical protein MUC49_04485 [Raineya sp.]|jgi:hypothetical protein|nr:hypothetical protein [Raineya sp.]